MLLLWFCTTSDERLLAYSVGDTSHQHHWETTINLLGGLLVGGWGGGLGPWLWGALAWWHIWMRAILWRRIGGCVNTRQTLYCFLLRENPFKLISAAPCIHQELVVSASELNVMDLLHSSPKYFSPFPASSLPSCPALSRPLWLGHRAIFAFSCIIQSAAHSRSQWGVVCALLCPPRCDVTSKELCSCVTSLKALGLWSPCLS